MSDRLKKLKKFSIAISYAALLSASTAFAADSETLKAQDDQFDIFDVESEQLDELDKAINGSAKIDDTQTLSEKDFEENFSDMDDLYVDSVNEMGDIEKKESTHEKSKTADNNDNSENVSSGKKEIKVEDEDYVFNSDNDGLNIPEAEEFKKLLMESEANYEDSDNNADINYVIDADENSAIDADENDAIDADENSAIDEIFSNFEKPDEDSSIENDTISDSMDIMDIDTESIDMDMGRMGMPEEEDTPKPKSTASNNSYNENIPDNIKLEYKKLKKHLDNFLLSFAGENEESISKASDYHDFGNQINGDDDFTIDEDIKITEYNPEELFPEDKTTDENYEINTEVDTGTGIDNKITSENISNYEENIENIENIANEEKDTEEASNNNNNNNNNTETAVNIESDNDAEEIKELEKGMDDFNNQPFEKEDDDDDLFDKMYGINDTDDATKTANNNNYSEQKRIMGSCKELSDKIANCESFECEMPNPANGENTIKVSISKDGDNCNYQTSMSDSKGYNCELNSGETSILSSLTESYFNAYGKENFDIKSEFPTQCASIDANTKIAKANTTTPKKPITPKPKKKELSPADKAYFEMLDKKRKALPKDKQLPDSVIETIREVAPSIAEDKKVKSATPKNVNISRGSGAPAPQEDDQAISSSAGMDISLSKKQSIESEVRLKMERAYKALLAGQTTAAVVLYNQVLAIDSDNMDALFGLATAYHKNYQYEQARTTYAKILHIEPNNKEVLNNFLVLVSEESPESALLELQKLERINSNFSPIPAQIAMIYLKLGQPETAERYLRRAVVLSPENITYKYNLAITSDKLNKHYQAINLYKQVLEAARKGAVIPGSVTSIANRMDYLEGKLSSMN